MLFSFRTLIILSSLFWVSAQATEDANLAGRLEAARSAPGASQQQLLYLNPDKIHSIRANHEKYPYLKFWNAVKDRAKKFVSVRPPATTAGIGEENLWKLGDGLPDLALSYLLTGQAIYLREARKWMDALCSYPDWASNKDIGAANLLFSMSIAYNWLHDDFSGEERDRYRQKLAKHADLLYQRLLKKDIWWMRQEYLTQNHNHQNVMALAIAGLALRGENQDAEHWLAAAKSNFDQVLDLLSPDGATHEGAAYWGTGVDAMLKYFLALPDQQGINAMRSSPFFQNTAKFRLYASMPGYAEVVDYGDSPRYEWFGPGYMLRALASVFNDGHAQWLAEAIEKARGKEAKNSWLDLLWFDAAVQTSPPDDLPTHAYFDNHGIFISRSDWTDKATWRFFKAGPPQGKLAEAKGLYTGGHIHPDEGEFLLWANGEWLVIDDGYVLKKRTENHNVLLFNGKGQLGEGQLWFDLKPLKQHRGTAAMIHADLQPNYQILTAELAGMYPPELGVKSWKRTFVALPRGGLIIRDLIAWHRPGEAKSRVHFAGLPRQTAPNAACLGTKTGLTVQSLLPRNSSFEIKKFAVEKSERTRSSNAEGGLLEVAGDDTNTFMLFLNAGNGACGSDGYQLTAPPDGNSVEITTAGESITVDFNTMSVTADQP